MSLGVPTSEALSVEVTLGHTSKLQILINHWEDSLHTQVWFSSHPRENSRRVKTTPENPQMNSIKGGFPGGSVVKNSPANAGDAALIPGSGRSLEKKIVSHSVQGNPVDRGA